MTDEEIVLTDEKVVKITFSTKASVKCPLCGEEIFREEILSGGGRLMAGELTNEFHRTYEKTHKYGVIYPLVYNITVCPYCYFAGFPVDFSNAFIKKNMVGSHKRKCAENVNIVRTLCPGIDFKKKRTLVDGVASYILALFSYEEVEFSFSPTLRKGMCCLRAAWLLDYLHVEQPSENYDELKVMFYKKAAFYYRRAVEIVEDGTEEINKIQYFGPDTDQNYGFEGVQYLSVLLEFKYGVRSDPVIRHNSLENARKILSQMVGMGKASHSKPSPVLETSRDIYDKVKAELKEIVKSGAISSNS